MPEITPDLLLTVGADLTQLRQQLAGLQREVNAVTGGESRITVNVATSGIAETSASLNSLSSQVTQATESAAKLDQQLRQAALAMAQLAKQRVIDPAVFAEGTAGFETMRAAAENIQATMMSLSAGVALNSEQWAKFQLSVAQARIETDVFRASVKGLQETQAATAATAEGIAKAYQQVSAAVGKVATGVADAQAQIGVAGAAQEKQALGIVKAYEQVSLAVGKMAVGVADAQAQIGIAGAAQEKLALGIVKAYEQVSLAVGKAAVGVADAQAQIGVAGAAQEKLALGIVKAYEQVSLAVGKAAVGVADAQAQIGIAGAAQEKLALGIVRSFEQVSTAVGSAAAGVVRAQEQISAAAVKAGQVENAQYLQRMRNLESLEKQILRVNTLAGPSFNLLPSGGAPGAAEQLAALQGARATLSLGGNLTPQAMADLTKGTNDLTRAMGDLSPAVAKNDSVLAAFGDSVLRHIKIIGALTVVYGAFQVATSAFKGLVDIDHDLTVLNTTLLASHDATLTVTDGFNLIVKANQALGVSLNQAGDDVLVLSRAFSGNAELVKSALIPSLTLATASGRDQASVVSVLIGAYNLYGQTLDQQLSPAQKFQQISADLFQVFSNSKISLSEFQTALAQVAPAAISAGLNLRQTVGILGVFSQGMQDASRSGQELRLLLEVLERRAPIIAKTFDIKFDPNALLNPIQLLTQVADKLKETGTLSLEANEKITNAFGSVRVNTALKTVLANFEAFKKAMDDANAASITFGQIQDSVSSSITVAFGRLGGAVSIQLDKFLSTLYGVEPGKLQGIAKAVDTITSAINLMGNAAERTAAAFVKLTSSSIYKDFQLVAGALFGARTPQQDLEAYKAAGVTPPPELVQQVTGVIPPSQPKFGAGATGTSATPEEILKPTPAEMQALGLPTGLPPRATGPPSTLNDELTARLKTLIDLINAERDALDKELPIADRMTAAKSVLAQRTKEAADAQKDYLAAAGGTTGEAVQNDAKVRSTLAAQSAAQKELTRLTQEQRDMQLAAAAKILAIDKEIAAEEEKAKDLGLFGKFDIQTSEGLAKLRQQLDEFVKLGPDAQLSVQRVQDLIDRYVSAREKQITQMAEQTLFTADDLAGKRFLETLSTVESQIEGVNSRRQAALAKQKEAIAASSFVVITQPLGPPPQPVSDQYVERITAELTELREWTKSYSGLQDQLTAAQAAGDAETANAISLTMELIRTKGLVLQGSQIELDLIDKKTTAEKAATASLNEQIVAYRTLTTARSTSDVVRATATRVPTPTSAFNLLAPPAPSLQQPLADADKFITRQVDLRTGIDATTKSIALENAALGVSADEAARNTIAITVLGQNLAGLGNNIRTYADLVRAAAAADAEGNTARAALIRAVIDGIDREVAAQRRLLDLKLDTTIQANNRALEDEASAYGKVGVEASKYALARSTLGRSYDDLTPKEQQEIELLAKQTELKKAAADISGLVAAGLDKETATTLALTAAREQDTLSLQSNALKALEVLNTFSQKFRQNATELAAAMAQQNNDPFGFFVASLASAGQKAGDFWANLKTLAEDTAKQMSTSLSDFFFNKFTGQLTSAKDLFKAFTDSLLRAIANFLANTVVQQFLTLLLGVGGQGLGSLGSLFGGGGGGGAGAGGAIANLAGSAITGAAAAGGGSLFGFSANQLFGAGTTAAGAGINAATGGGGLLSGLLAAPGNVSAGFANGGGISGAIQALLLGQPATAGTAGGATGAAVSTAAPDILSSIGVGGTTFTPAELAAAAQQAGLEGVGLGAGTAGVAAGETVSGAAGSAATSGLAGFGGAIGAASTVLSAVAAAYEIYQGITNLSSDVPSVKNAGIGALAGVGGGAAAGAAIGSIWPGVGTAIGAILGAALGGAGGGFLGGLFGSSMTGKQREALEANKALAGNSAFQGAIATQTTPTGLFNTLVAQQSGYVGGTKTPAIGVSVKATYTRDELQAAVARGDILLPPGQTIDQALSIWGGPNAQGVAQTQFGPGLANSSIPVYSQQGFFKAAQANPSGITASIQQGVSPDLLAAGNASTAASVQTAITNITNLNDSINKALAAILTNTVTPATVTMGDQLKEQAIQFRAIVDSLIVSNVANQNRLKALLAATTDPIKVLDYTNQIKDLITSRYQDEITLVKQFGSALDTLASDLTKVSQSIVTQINSLQLSTQSATTNPMAALTQAQGIFAAAQATFTTTPNAVNAQAVQAAVDAVLQQAAAVYTRPSPEYAAIFNNVIGVLQSVKGKVDQQATDITSSLTLALGTGNTIADITATNTTKMAADMAALKSIAEAQLAGQGFSIPGMQHGGHVRGQGRGDTVPAMLEPGEFVVRRDVAQKHRKALEALNGPQQQMEDGEHHAHGGSIGRASKYHMRRGGPVQDTTDKLSLKMQTGGVVPNLTAGDFGPNVPLHPSAAWISNETGLPARDAAGVVNPTRNIKAGTVDQSRNITAGTVGQASTPSSAVTPVTQNPPSGVDVGAIGGQLASGAGQALVNAIGSSGTSAADVAVGAATDSLISGDVIFGAISAIPSIWEGLNDYFQHLAHMAAQLQETKGIRSDFASAWPIFAQQSLTFDQINAIKNTDPTELQKQALLKLLSSAQYEVEQGGAVSQYLSTQGGRQSWIPAVDVSAYEKLSSKLAMDGVLAWSLAEDKLAQVGATDFGGVNDLWSAPGPNWVLDVLSKYAGVDLRDKGPGKLVVSAPGIPGAFPDTYDYVPTPYVLSPSEMDAFAVPGHRTENLAAFYRGWNPNFDSTMLGQRLAGIPPGGGVSPETIAAFEAKNAEQNKNLQDLVASGWQPADADVNSAAYIAAQSGGGGGGGGAEHGAWFTRGAMYELHEGEMVLPSKVADVVRSGSSQMNTDKSVTMTIAQGAIVINGITDPAQVSQTVMDRIEQAVRTGKLGHVIKERVR